VDDDLLAAIYARPWDDALRQVYADRLCERGDELGELIQLQLAPRLDARQRAREAELHEHARIHLRSPLGPVLHSAVYRRGFIAEVQVAWHTGREVSALGAHPAWSTIENLTFLSSARPEHAARARLLQHLPRTLRSLRRLHLLDEGGVQNLCEAPEPWDLVDLRANVRTPLSIGLLQRTELLPALTTLHLNTNDPVWVRDAKLWPRVASLHVAVSEVDALWDWRSHAHAALEELAVEHQGMVYEVRGAGMTRLCIHPAPFYGLRVAEAIDVLERAPAGALTEVRIESEDALADVDRRRIDAAVRRQERLASLEVVVTTPSRERDRTERALAGG
jgi:uncharacterized protein (TIGR02996 family)